jgi:hypothetical protein
MRRRRREMSGEQFVQRRLMRHSIHVADTNQETGRSEQPAT